MFQLSCTVIHSIQTTHLMYIHMGCRWPIMCIPNSRPMWLHANHQLAAKTPQEELKSGILFFIYLCLFLINIYKCQCHTVPRQPANNMKDGLDAGLLVQWTMASIPDRTRAPLSPCSIRSPFPWFCNPFLRENGDIPTHNVIEWANTIRCMCGSTCAWEPPENLV